MNKYDINLDSWTNIILPAISIVGFVVIACLVTYNCINYGGSFGGTYVTGW